MSLGDKADYYRQRSMLLQGMFQANLQQISNPLLGREVDYAMLTFQTLSMLAGNMVEIGFEIAGQLEELNMRAAGVTVPTDPESSFVLVFEDGMTFPAQIRAQDRVIDVLPRIFEVLKRSDRAGHAVLVRAGAHKPLDVNTTGADVRGWRITVKSSVKLKGGTN